MINLKVLFVNFLIHIYILIDIGINEVDTLSYYL
jgi:hypothetical protein